jgi:hypothetical protein
MRCQKKIHVSSFLYVSLPDRVHSPSTLIEQETATIMQKKPMEAAKYSFSFIRPGPGMS